MSQTETRLSRELARELGRRLSVAGALLVALVALLSHAPLWIACLRGAATLLVLGCGTRLGTAALVRSIDFDRAYVKPKEGARP